MLRKLRCQICTWFIPWRFYPWLFMSIAKLINWIYMSLRVIFYQHCGSTDSIYVHAQRLIVLDLSHNSTFCMGSYPEVTLKYIVFEISNPSMLNRLLAYREYRPLKGGTQWQHGVSSPLKGLHSLEPLCCAISCIQQCIVRFVVSDGY